MALSVIACLQACSCQRRTAVETPIPEGEPCEVDDRCETSLCDSANGGPKVCLRACAIGCRGPEVCTQLAADRFACVPERAGLCRACTKDSDCPQAADKCIVLGETAFCGRDCSFDESCPNSFRCGDATTITGQLATRQCQPSSGTCECIAATSGQQKPCDVTNNFGTCTGISVCRPPEGYSSCNARTPTAEVCNSVDDDCNGQTDEGLGDVTCGLGECRRSVAACISGAAQTCVPGTPGVELCNGRDDDCDGMVDNGFSTQTDVAHCGACNTACILTNAVPACVAGMCAVSRCQPGWSDLDGNPANGCEYPCQPSDAGGEVCNGVDDDCDGIVDNGFDLVSDPNHCGQCNLECSVSGTTVSTYSCVARVCGIGTCTPGRGNCNQQYGDGCEVDLTNDPAHCGTCSTACTTPNATATCVNGTCGVGQCNPNFANCNGTVADGCEVNTNTSANNCGACGTVCNANNASSSCSNGSCAYTCNPNFWDVDGLASNGCEYNCIRTAGGVEQCDGIDNDCDNRIDEDFDLTSNAAHCGQCNRACTAPFATTACSTSACGITACDSGRANCNGVYVDGCEVNTQSDLANCGTCGSTCSTPNATAQCLTGACGIQSCNAGFNNCNGLIADGCEINTQNNVSHCGACGNGCTAANGTPQCASGTCGVESCNNGFRNCNNVASDGCEVAINTDVNNCGACNVACNTPNATPSCTTGTCGIQSCNAGFRNCNGLLADGCEVNFTNDINNCGACGNVCSTANGAPACNNGICGIACGSGFADCNGQIGDGCEVNTNASTSHCGACNNACVAANATPACSNGSCTIGTCSGTFRDCNGQLSDGCEINSGNNVNNCGACNNACAVANATPACVSSACAIGACNSGFRDCNSQVVDGCETNTNTAVTSCGTCGNVCTVTNGTPGCSGGSCTVASCTGAWRDCNGQVTDGCEVNTSNTIANCGACGTVCNFPHAAPVCSSGTCGIASCLPGWVNANGQLADGCEYACVPSNGGVEICDGVDNDCDTLIDEGFNLTSDVNNCGACNNVCTAANVLASQCTTGNCGVVACTNGFANCDGVYSTGCEININTNVNSCGSCGNVCNLPNAGEACLGGICQVATCEGSFRNCNGTHPDGCEININTSVSNCGGCGNVCNTPNATNTCTGGTCGFTCPANRWDLDGNPANGCEYVCTFISAVDLPDLGLVDANCDGIDGEVNNSVFVTTTGSDGNPGTRTAPKLTLAGALSAAISTNKRDVLVAGGGYLGQVNITAPNKGLYGGYTAGTWARALTTAVTVTGTNTPLSITNANNAVVQLMTFNGADPVGVSATAYGALIVNSASVQLERVNISAGAGTAGSSGGTGASGAAGGNGGQGAPGCEDSSFITCRNCSRPTPGAGGTSTCGRNGGRGGFPGNEHASGEAGLAGVTANPGPGTPSGGGNWATPAIYWGANGAAVSNGTNGSSGGNFGVLGPVGYTVANTTDGTDGADGNGGGGGGGGGGGPNACDSYGGAGSGGGAGGCKGTRGTRGTSGGGSFGIMLWNSTVQATTCVITASNGGAGGNGGPGGIGGNGGSGGPRNNYGGSGEQDDGSNGAPGGNGSKAGNGGAGGAGGGGPSIGVARGGGSTWSATGSTVNVGIPGGGGTSNAGDGQVGTVTTLY